MKRQGNMPYKNTAKAALCLALVCTSAISHAQRYSSVIDPIADSFVTVEGETGYPDGPVDLSEVVVCVGSDSVAVHISFTQETLIRPPSIGSEGTAVEGFLEIDVDNDSETGLNPSPADAFRTLIPSPATGLGAEIVIDLAQEQDTPGFLTAIRTNGGTELVPVFFRDQQLSLSLPRVLLEDAGLVDELRIGLLVGNEEAFTDSMIEDALTVSTEAADSETAGDYDSSGVVDLLDYDMWSQSFGALSAADGNCDGITDAADYTVWRDALGNSASSRSVPEPAATPLVLSAISVVMNFRKARP